MSRGSQRGILGVNPWWRVTLLYVGFGFAWIIVSDLTLREVVEPDEMLTRYQTVKGWVFVAVSGFLIFLITREAFLRRQMEERARMELVRRTVSQSHHILLNYLNQMQVVTLEAERSADFDRETLALAQEISAEAARELVRLHDLEEASGRAGNPDADGGTASFDPDK